MIPEAAVEAAGQALRGAFDWGVADFDKQARAALEAAAPHMLAEAWDDGHSAGIDHADGLDGGSNPYDRPTP